jgi:hypothetical protein
MKFSLMQEFKLKCNFGIVSCIWWSALDVVIDGGQLRRNSGVFKTGI